MNAKRQFDEIDRYLQKRTEQGLFSGVVRMTKGLEEVFAKPYGLASRTWNAPMTMDMRFDTASITKLMTAVATLQLVDCGIFDLNTPVLSFLKLKGTTISEKATVFHLLTHSSGIGDDCEEEDGEDYAELWIEKPCYSIQKTADFLPQFATKPANFLPGERCRYCNCGFILLGLMIEKATGQTYRDYVQEHIFDAAGMKDSGFFAMDDCEPRVAEGCDPIRNDDGTILRWKRNIFSFPSIGSPDSGAHVTALDLDRFLRAAKDGVLLSPINTQRLFAPQIPYQEKEGWSMHYGFGLWFYVSDDGTVVCCQKEGYNAGVSGIVRYFFEKDINLVILSNMADGAWEPAWKIHAILMEQEGSMSS